MVAEEIDDRGPDGVRRGVGNTDDAEDVARDGVVDPIDQALINHEPLWIGALSGGWSSVDVGAETELAKDGVEEAPPFGIVRVDDVEHHQNMGLDVDRLEGRGWNRMNRWWWWRRPASIIERSREGCDGGGRRRGTAMGGLLEIEQRIDIHGGQRKRRRALATGDQTALNDTIKQSWIKPRVVLIS